MSSMDGFAEVRDAGLELRSGTDLVLRRSRIRVLFPRNRLE